jgi:hypothetical protein
MTTCGQSGAVVAWSTPRLSGISSPATSARDPWLSFSFERGFPLRYSWLLAGRGFRGSGDAGPQHLVVTRFQEYQDGNPLSFETQNGRGVRPETASGADNRIGPEWMPDEAGGDG